ncbi:MAG: hypothetical protein OXM88_09320 [bacterium]|nr:hypothetical protein [bacterium]
MAELRANIASPRRGGNVRFDVERTLRNDPKELVKVINRAVRSSTYWPVRSGKSRRGWRARVFRTGLVMLNRYRYAYIVENISATRTASGRRWGTSPRYPLTETISEAIDRNRAGETTATGSFLRGVGEGITRTIR